jgi:hypothetical protein
MYKRNINPHIAGFVLKHGDSYTVHMEIGKWVKYMIYI